MCSNDGEALVSFRDSYVYEIETKEGKGKGLWVEQTQSFLYFDGNSSIRAKAPSFLDHDSDLVAWKELGPLSSYLSKQAC